MESPILAITMGDPAGVGPETIVSAWSSGALHAAARAVVLGRPEVLRRAARLLESPVRVVEVSSVDELPLAVDVLPCLACGDAAADSFTPATISAAAGEAAYQAICRAAELAQAGEVDAIVTAPINKAALWQAGHHFPGHTELLAHLCGVREVAMMLYQGPGAEVRGRVGLGVVHATLHCSLREAIERLSGQRIVTSARLLDGAMRKLLAGDTALPPRLAVCALNPHAGEEGLFGREEIDIIRPAVEEIQAGGLDVCGPLPADSVFQRAVAGEFDGVVAVYHDQGHIALKLLDMQRAVNVTLGLPIIRTSVAHGTAFDRAWQGQADCRGLISAATTATQLSLNQRRLSGTFTAD